MSWTIPGKRLCYKVAGRFETHAEGLCHLVEVLFCLSEVTLLHIKVSLQARMPGKDVVGILEHFKGACSVPPVVAGFQMCCALMGGQIDGIGTLTKVHGGEGEAAVPFAFHIFERVQKGSVGAKDILTKAIAQHDAKCHVFHFLRGFVGEVDTEGGP